MTGVPPALRLPVAQVAQRGLSAGIDRLVENGVIKVCAVVDPGTVGYPITADVWIEVEPGQAMSVAQHLTQYEQITYVACSTGDRDISVQVVALSVEQLYRFSTEVLGNVPGVRKTTTLIVPRILKDVYDWDIPHSSIDLGAQE